MQQLASDAAEAASALQSVNLGGGAFGVLCAWIVPPVSLVSSAVAQHISAAEGVLERTGEEMRSAVTDFETYEQAVTQATETIESGLGS
jgi:hypothetical protein